MGGCRSCYCAKRSSKMIDQLNTVKPRSVYSVTELATSVTYTHYQVKDYHITPSPLGCPSRPSWPAPSWSTSSTPCRCPAWKTDHAKYKTTQNSWFKLPYIVTRPSAHPFNRNLRISDFVYQCVSTTGDRIEDDRRGGFLTERACKCLQTSAFNNHCSPLWPTYGLCQGCIWFLLIESQVQVKCKLSAGSNEGVSAGPSEILSGSESENFRESDSMYECIF